MATLTVLYLIVITTGIVEIGYAMISEEPMSIEAPDHLYKRNISATQSIDFIGSVDGKTFYSTDARMSWSQSLDFCHSYEMKLAAVTSVAQRNLLSQYLSSGVYSQITFFYLRGVDHGSENTWRSLFDGEVLTYLPWCSGQPRVDDPGWNCQAMNSNGCWQNQNCGDIEPHRYVLGPLCET